MSRQAVLRLIHEIHRVTPDSGSGAQEGFAA
jgi:hypothetical protein